MAINVAKMREDADVYRAAVRELERNEGCSVERVPIESWHGREYAVLRGPKLSEGLQRLEVLDLTDFDATEHGGLRAARFARNQPEWDRWQTFEGETEEQIDRRLRRYVLMLYPSEGHTSILTADGGIRWATQWIGDLPVRLVPGTRADYDAVRLEQMDELEAHVDAGGSLSL